MAIHESNFGNERRVVASGSADIVKGVRTEADTHNRLEILGNGTVNFGSGSAATDVTLYRSAADTLKTDDSLIVAGSLTSTAGALPAAGAVYTATRAQFWINNLVPSYPALGDAADQVPTAGTVYFGALYLPVNYTITGIGFVVGSVGGTDKAIGALYSSAGAVLANTDLAGTTVGSADTVQQIALTATYAATGPGLYYVSLSLDGNTARLAASPAVGRAGSAAGVFATLASITPPTANAAAPQAYVY